MDGQAIHRKWVDFSKVFVEKEIVRLYSADGLTSWFQDSMEKRNWTEEITRDI